MNNHAQTALPDLVLAHATVHVDLAARGSKGQAAASSLSSPPPVSPPEQGEGPAL